MPFKRKTARCEQPAAKRVAVVGDRLRVDLEDGRKLDLPLRWFPIVDAAPLRAQRKVRVIFAGTGIEWPDLGYELGVGGLARQRRALDF